MLSDAHLIAFVPPVLAWSTRLDRSRAFYVGVLGLQEQSTTPYACVLSAAGVQLRITLVGELRPQPFTVLGWQVAAASGQRRVATASPGSMTRTGTPCPLPSSAADPPARYPAQASRPRYHGRGRRL
jgi:catechol 2,3-dioxygenase-like lactoylglutathione lyase family enzyme